MESQNRPFEAPLFAFIQPIFLRVVEATSTATATAPASMGRMEIVLVGGERILVGADVDATALARIVKALGRR